MTDRDLVSSLPREGGQKLLHAVLELKLSLIEQRHDRCHVDRLGNRAEQEHRIIRGGLAKVARKRLIFLSDMQHGGIYLLGFRGPLQHGGCLIPPLATQGCEQWGRRDDCPGRPQKGTTLHHTNSSTATTDRNHPNVTALRHRAAIIWTMTVTCQSPDRQGGVQRPLPDGRGSATYSCAVRYFFFSTG